MFSIVQNFANKNTIFKKNYHTIAWQVNPNKKNFTHIVHHCKMYNAVVLVLNSKKSCNWFVFWRKKMHFLNKYLIMSIMYLLCVCFARIVFFYLNEFLWLIHTSIQTKVMRSMRIINYHLWIWLYRKTSITWSVAFCNSIVKKKKSFLIKMFRLFGLFTANKKVNLFKK